METNAGPRPATQAFLGTAPAGRWDRRLATAFIVLSFAGLIAIAPIARMKLAPLPSFVPAYESALWICDVITAVLLLGQFYRSQSPSILVLSSGYLMSSLIIVPHLMAFPGVFATAGLLGGNSQTIGWLYVFWHAAFPLFVLAHSLTAKAEAAKGWRWPRPGPAIAGAVVLVAAGVVLATALATHPAGLLPVISINGDYSSMITTGVSPVMIAVAIAALLVLWRNSRGTVLDVWLMVVMCGWICDIALSSIVSDSRFDLGWYAGRAFALASGAFLLGVLLLDLGRLYVSLADALEASQTHNEALIRSREELMRAQRLEAVGKLTGGIAHDFNNMLTAIIGYLDMICRHPTDSERVVQMARRASNAADRGAQLIKQLLTFARKQNLRPQVLNPNDLLLEMSGLAQKALKESIVLSLDLAEDIDCVCVDAAEFQACILNLVGNARDAMPEGGTLGVSTRNVVLDAGSEARGAAPGPYVLLTVSDTGHGMDEATLTHVFEPFFTTKDIGKGTGLGLSQVHGFAHSAKGLVEITSEQEEGTTVSIYLPQTLERPAADSGRAPPRFDARKQRVLVVEDDADVMNTAAECLRDCGFEVLTAADGDEGLAILRSARRVDILFSDIAMPGSLNGVQLARAGVVIWPKLKVLLTSGYAGTLLEDRGFDEDWPLLSKPYHRDDLLRLLETLAGTEEGLPPAG